MKLPFLDFSTLLPYKNKLKKLMGTAVGFLLVFTLYYTIIKQEWKIAYSLFYVATGLLFCVVFFLNGGFSKNLPTADQLRDDWSQEKKAAFLNRLAKNREIAQKLFYLLIPMILCLFIDIVWVVWLEGGS
jgi:hypothetical protein